MDVINIFRLGIYSTKFYCFCCFNCHINILSRYFGHGTGREFLQGDDIQRLDCRAVTLLMGCSSGKLQVSIFQTVEEHISIQLVQTNQQRQRKCSIVWFFCEVCMLRLGHISNWIVLNSQGWWWVWAKRDGIKLSSCRLVCFWCSFVALVCLKKSLWLCSISVFNNLFTKQLVILY